MKTHDATTERIRRRRRDAEGGFGLIEVVAAFAVLAIGLLSHAFLTTAGHLHQRHVDESRLALQAARSQIEEIWSGNFATLFVAYDESTDNDPPFDPAPGPHFDVFGLSPSPADPDGRVGRVRFPVASVGGEWVLREDLDMPQLGLPFDLDGDGAIDSGAKDDTYVHLPVLIEIRWSGAAGEQVLRVPTWITSIR
jgi:type II secretory pathway pseudopilin PulG